MFNSSRFSRLILLFAFLACLAFPAFLASFAFAISSVNVPLDSWVYEALEKLEGYALIESAVSGTRPYCRLEAARLISEALKKWDDLILRKKPPGFAEEKLIPSLLKRFQREFKAELTQMGVIEGSPVPTYLKPVDEVILKYIFQTDNPVKRPQNALPSTHTVYSIYNNDGIVYQKYNNFSADFLGEGRLWNHFSLYYQLILKLFESKNTDLDVEKWHLKAEGLNIELEVGRDSLWWGPGRHGALLMTNNARPFDMVKFSNPRPFLLPLLGPLKFNLFFSRLDYGDPFIANPLLYGLRLNFKPHPIFELGISHVVIFEGEGRRDLSIGDYFNILYGNVNREGTKLDSNQQFSIDLSLRWPNFDKILRIARSLKLYGEIGAEDTGYPPDRRAYMLGFFLTDLFLLGRIDLRFEYWNTSPGSVPRAWYTHPFYPPIYYERIFGHHVGSNGEDIFVRLTSYLSPKFLLGFDFDIETHGRKDAIKTNSYQFGADLDYLIRDGMNIKGRYILEFFRDPSSIAGGDATHQIFAIQFRWCF